LTDGGFIHFAQSGVFLHSEEWHTNTLIVIGLHPGGVFFELSQAIFCGLYETATFDRLEAFLAFFCPDF